MRVVVARPGSVPAWWNTNEPGTWTPVVRLTTFTFASVIPAGSSGSLTRIWMVFAAIVDASTGFGAGSLVAGTVPMTTGGPGCVSVNGDTQVPADGQLHVWKHVLAAFAIGAAFTTRTCGEAPP